MTEHVESLMNRLREATRDLHKHAESRTLQTQMFRGEVAREAFAAYLAQLYLVHRELESALERVGPSSVPVARVAKRDRWHADLLRQDLDHYRVGLDTIEPCAATADFLAEVGRLEQRHPISLLGPLYVLEGSTNGSKVLARVLGRAWQTDGAGLAYLDPYGEEQTDRWASFKNDMDALDLDEEARQGIVTAACQAFEMIADISDQVASEHVEGIASSAQTVA